MNPIDSAIENPTWPGAFVDLLVVNGNPVKDISMFVRPEESLAAIMKGSQFRHRSI
jgi:hypothetical protein